MFSSSSNDNTSSTKRKSFPLETSDSISTHSISSLLPEPYYLNAYQNNNYFETSYSSGYEPDIEKTSEDDGETNSLNTQLSIYLARSWLSTRETTNTTSTDYDSESTFDTNSETATSNKEETRVKSGSNNSVSPSLQSSSSSDTYTSPSSLCSVCKLRKQFKNFNKDENKEDGENKEYENKKDADEKL